MPTKTAKKKPARKTRHVAIPPPTPTPAPVARRLKPKPEVLAARVEAGKVHPCSTTDRLSSGNTSVTVKVVEYGTHRAIDILIQKGPGPGAFVDTFAASTYAHYLEAHGLATKEVARMLMKRIDESDPHSEVKRFVGDLVASLRADGGMIGIRSITGFLETWT